MVLTTVREAGAGSYWLVSVAVAEPPAGIVTVIGSDGVVVTSTVAVLPSTGSAMTHVVPAGSPVMVNGGGVRAPAGMGNVVGVPPHVAVISIGPCCPAMVPVICLTTVSDPSIGV